MTSKQPKSLFSGRNTKTRAQKSRLEGGSLGVVSIYGIGLIGGSMAERLHRANKKTVILGCDDIKITRKARRLVLIDETISDDAIALSRSDVVILAATPSANQKILRRLSRVVIGDEENAPLIIDTGSTQSSIAELGKTLKWKNSAQFIAGHPMAGRELAGLEHRQADLFDNHPFFFDAGVKLDKKHLTTLRSLTMALGSYVMFVEAKRHDRVMTDISHIPQLISTVIGSFVCGYDKETLHLAGSGLQSMIRLGGSQYPIWRDVFADNNENVLQRLDALITELQSARDDLASGRGLSKRFKQAQRSYQCLW